MHTHRESASKVVKCENKRDVFVRTLHSRLVTMGIDGEEEAQEDRQRKKKRRKNESNRRYLPRLLKGRNFLFLLEVSGGVCDSENVTTTMSV